MMYLLPRPLGLAKDLDIRLNAPVEAIHYDENDAGNAKGA